ncbi:MAG: helix-turn-helix domain-containing protein [bacterium]
MKRNETPHQEKPEAAPTTIGLLLNKNDIAKRCNVSVRTVDSWIRTKKIPSIKISRAIRFRWNAVEAALLRYERKEVC